MAKRRAARPPAPPAFSAFKVKEAEFEQDLLTGAHARDYEQLLGEDNYVELCELAKQAAGRSVRGGPRVLILPGIMGSHLGTSGRVFNNTIWLDPFDLARGKIATLSLDRTGTNIEALGVLAITYAKLKFRLRIAGFDADHHPYDWRQSLRRLGSELRRRIAAERTGSLAIVAHSMGGLVTRAALSSPIRKLNRVVMLGTPNHGSYLPVQALEGSAATVRKLATLDLRHSLEELVNDVLASFPSLYQMLPFREKLGALDLYDVRVWPTHRPRPRRDILRATNEVQQSLHPGDERFRLIAGVNRETVTGISKNDGEFAYHFSLAGDGTVPLAFAELSGVPTYYSNEAHGSLPNNRTVTRATIELLESGVTDVLPRQWTPQRRGDVRVATTRELEAEELPVRAVEEYSHREFRNLASELVAAESHEEEARAGIDEVEVDRQLHGVVVARRRQHRINIRLANGSITDIPTQALVLGMFRDVTPSGPAAALDDELGGAITEFTQRRMFSANVGEVFMIPTGRNRVRAEMALFVGLGTYDRFDGNVAQLVAENVIRTFVRTSVSEFSTVLIGAGSGQDVRAVVQNLVAGFVRGLIDADTHFQFRELTFCELDRERYLTVRDEILRLSSSSLFEDVEVTLDELQVPQVVAPPPAAARRRATGPAPCYLIVRENAAEDSQCELRISLLTAGGKATVVTDTQTVDTANLDAHLRRIESTRFTFSRLEDFGTKLADLVLPSRVAAVLKTVANHPLVVVHDAPSSRIPWETICVDGWFPAAQRGVSRRYLAENMSIAKWLQQRETQPRLDILLVVNPTEDLPGADEEGKRIKELLGGRPGIRLVEIRESQATRERLMREFQSGRYDAIHYAGHAFFDPRNPSRSGMLCAGEQVLDGASLAQLGNLPALVFFNACEAGRVRRGTALQDEQLDVSKRIDRNVGLAEAFLRGGVANYVGTYWPVGDAAAKAFADAFYGALLQGQAIGDALTQGRKELQELKSVDWADYILYGDHAFVLKVPEQPGPPL